MRILIISDIHGNYINLNKIVRSEVFDRLVILGDLFNYDQKIIDFKNNNIINILKEYKDKLILIKGNCDYNIDYKTINLYANDIITMPFNKNNVTFTHGDKYNSFNLPSFCGNIFISGHTHVALLYKCNDMIFANPGSISYPRGTNLKTYLIYDNNKLILKDINKNIIKEMLV